MRGIINALASSATVGLESIASEPVITPASLAGRAVGVVATVLAVNVSTGKQTAFETVLGGFLLCLGREISRCQKLINKVLILTDSVAEHASMVPVVVDAPLDIHDLARAISCHR
jgi:hypothetical protein